MDKGKPVALERLTDKDVEHMLKISSVIENAPYLLTAGRHTVLAANSKSGSASGSKSGGVCKARS